MMAEGAGEVKREAVETGAGGAGGRPTGARKPAGSAGQFQAQPGRAGAASGGPAAAPRRVCERNPGAHLRLDRDGPAQAAPQPLVCAALPAAGPEMVPTPQGHDRLGTSMPTPMPMH